jgi:hypothetical protein
LTATLAGLRREVSEIKQTIDSKFSTVRHVLILAFSCGDEPHGVYRHHALVLESGKQTVERAMPTDWELKDLAKAYKEGTNSWQNPKLFTGENIYGNDKEFYMLYPTFESYLEMRRCKCGRHGPDNNQAFGEVLEE